MLYLLSLFYIIPIVFKILTIKYLQKVKNHSNCEKLNSPYLSFYYYYEWLELIAVIIMMILTFVILYSYSPTKKRKKYIKIKTNNTTYMSFNLISVILLSLYIKLLYDIGQEEECKHVEPGIRTFLFYMNIISLIVIISDSIFM